MNPSEAGWQADPTGRHEHRYWDGAQWTDNVADAGVAATDPFDAIVPPSAASPAEPSTNPYDTPVTAQPDAPAAWGDPTQVSTTSTDPTSTWPAAPAPPVYIPPDSPISDGGGDGSKKGFLIGLGVLLAVAAAVIAFLALGGDDDDEGDRIASEDTTTTTEEAGELTPTTGEVDDPFSDGGIGELPENFEEELADIYVESMGLSRDQAECLAESLGDVVRSGEMSEDEAFSDFMNYMEDCDISMEDLANN